MKFFHQTKRKKKLVKSCKLLFRLFFSKTDAILSAMESQKFITTFWLYKQHQSMLYFHALIVSLRSSEELSIELNVFVMLERKFTKLTPWFIESFAAKATRQCFNNKFISIIPLSAFPGINIDGRNIAFCEPPSCRTRSFYFGFGRASCRYGISD